MSPTAEPYEGFEAWAIVELFGHQKIAGRISEQIIGGCSFVRVDVPEQAVRETHSYLPDDPAVAPFTKLYGQGAIYAISIVSEDVARRAAASLRARPVQAYDLARDAPARLEHRAVDREAMDEE